MKTFEEQIQAACRERRRRDANDLSTPACPHVQKYPFTKRVATPAAAVIGLLFGWLFAKYDGMSSQTPAMLCSSDTIYEVLYDTLKVANTPIETIVSVSMQPTSTQPMQPQRVTEQKGKSILEDGIDYSLFVTRMEI
ncbi:MAG: hypothetical protein NC038_06870 [Paludibacter sp.]|nr:hypothetical protein [Bacteroidales bacterium]MCM1069623.1 hypothetical protein [Prevotella sp.]MCM1354269.1 hypothetical protein [Bacteroides sp.]MCM1443108.1 hypothetical protein [Muribaculum sp.]MCM1482343.1 hypothetical protein [Paludibacter sp.]